MPTALRQPVTFALSGKTAPNRILASSMSEGLATVGDDRADWGKPDTEAFVKRYQDLADGGAGIICFGGIHVNREWLQMPGNTILDYRNAWDAAEAWKPSIAAAKSKGAIVLGQLQFNGRNCSIPMNPKPISSSDVQLGPALDKVYGKPRPMTLAEIEDLKRRYVWAAKQLVEGGADGITLIACHGYILTQFLSPRINKRTDQYGGSLENRARLLLESVKEIKAALPPTSIIGVKLACDDFIEGGVTAAEYATVAKWLEDAGVDLFDISGGTYEAPAWRGTLDVLKSRQMQQEYGSYFLDWTKELKGGLSRAVVGTTGGWRNADSMEKAVSDKLIDVVGLGTPLLKDQAFPKKILDGEIKDVVFQWP